MRLCPSVEGSASPLITHRIGVEVCLARQRTFFHKCHRCIYRGQAAAWEPAEAQQSMLNMHDAEEPHHADVVVVEVARPVEKVGKAAEKANADQVDVKKRAAKKAKTVEAGT